MQYNVIVPPTMEQGGYKTRVNDVYRSKAAEALQDYNSARAHDGQEPLKRMPKGTEYRPLYLYVVQSYTGSQYGWEDVTAEETRKEGKERLTEYQENEPEYRHRMIRRPLPRPE